MIPMNEREICSRKSQEPAKEKSKGSSTSPEMPWLFRCRLQKAHPRNPRLNGAEVDADSLRAEPNADSQFPASAGTTAGTLGKEVIQRAGHIIETMPARICSANSLDLSRAVRKMDASLREHFAARSLSFKMTLLWVQV